MGTLSLECKRVRFVCREAEGGTRHTIGGLIKRVSRDEKSWLRRWDDEWLSLSQLKLMMDSYPPTMLIDIFENDAVTCTVQQRPHEWKSQVVHVDGWVEIKGEGPGWGVVCCLPVHCICSRQISHPIPGSLSLSPSFLRVLSLYLCSNRKLSFLCRSWWIRNHDTN